MFYEILGNDEIGIIIKHFRCEYDYCNCLINKSWDSVLYLVYDESETVFFF